VGDPGLSRVVAFAPDSNLLRVCDLPNIFLTHYQDLKTDLGGEVKRIADFLGIEPTPELIRLVETRCSFEAMKREAAALSPEMGQILEGGAERFFHKGVSGRWKEIFTSEELELYEAAIRSALSPECARWLELGRRAMP
jgi:aryl sulfotransferase